MRLPELTRATAYGKGRKCPSGPGIRQLTRVFAGEYPATHLMFMNTAGFVACVALALAAFPFAHPAAAQQSNSPPAKPGADQPRVQWNTMTPEQRQAKVRELQSQHPKTNDWASGSWPGQLKDLTPEQREAKVKELREKFIASQTNGPAAANIAAERQAKLKAKLAELQKKQAAGTLNPEEKQLLPKLEAAVRQFGQPVPAASLDAKPSAAKPTSAQ
jgi:hypothetical protein